MSAEPRTSASVLGGHGPGKPSGSGELWGRAGGRSGPVPPRSSLNARPRKGGKRPGPLRPKAFAASHSSTVPVPGCRGLRSRRDREKTAARNEPQKPCLRSDGVRGKMASSGWRRMFTSLDFVAATPARGTYACWRRGRSGGKKQRSSRPTSNSSRCGPRWSRQKAFPDSALGREKLTDMFRPAYPPLPRFCGAPMNYWIRRRPNRTDRTDFLAGGPLAKGRGAMGPRTAFPRKQHRKRSRARQRIASVGPSSQRQRRWVVDRRLSSPNGDIGASLARDGGDLQAARELLSGSGCRNGGTRAGSGGDRERC